MPWGRHPQPGPAIYGRGQRELISVPVIPHTNSSEITHTQTNPLKRKHLILTVLDQNNEWYIIQLIVLWN